MTYIHDFTGRVISQDTYEALPNHERRHYHAKREDSNRYTEDGLDIIDVGIEAARIGIVLGDFASDSNVAGNFGLDSNSSEGFDNGFGDGDFSGGGAGSDYDGFN